MRIWIGFILLPLFLACSNPRNTKLPQDIASLESIKPSVDKLTEEEKTLLTGYIMRHTIGSAFGAAFGKKSDPIPQGMTIGKAIDEQKAFIQAERNREIEEKAKKDRIAAARKAASDQLAQMLTIRLVRIKVESEDQFGFSKRINFYFEMENKSQKTIVGLKGDGVLKDRFGDVLASPSMKTEVNIAPGQIIKTSMGRSYNQFREEDKKLASADALNCSFIFTPSIVLFSDGTKIETPEAE